MLLTLDFTEAERRFLAWHFGEGTMIDKDALAQATDARLATASPGSARMAENAATGLARRVAAEPALAVEKAEPGSNRPHPSVPRPPKD